MVNTKIDNYAIYSDHFRGLPNGWHNLLSFNFLVGENSTGKSSFLQLIEIIDSQAHIFFLDICGIVPGIDTAHDVISRIDGKKETTIGFLIKAKPSTKQGAPRSENPPPVYGRLATYRMEGPSLVLSKVSILAHGKILRLRRSSNGIASRVDVCSYSENLSHSENGRQFQDLHFQRGAKLTKLEEVDWQEIDETSAWLGAVTKASQKSQPPISTAFFQVFPPLRCVQYGPLRGRTRRLYHGVKADFSSTGEHTPFMIRDAVDKKSELMSTVESFGKESGLFDTISAVSVRTPVNDRPFALQVTKSGRVFYLDELGFGVGQILPIVADIVFSPVHISFLIQQPELHLHPRAQASLGDVFMKASERGRMMVVETHSDFIIDRFRLSLKKSNIKPTAQIVYFEKDADTGQNAACEIEILPNGELGRTPESYREFFINESIDQFENF